MMRDANEKPKPVKARVISVKLILFVFEECAKQMQEVLRGLARSLQDIR